MAPIFNNEQWAVIGATTKIMWEEQLLDPTNSYITPVMCIYVCIYFDLLSITFIMRKWLVENKMLSIYTTNKSP